MHKKLNYSFVVSKHINAVWIKRIMFIIEKANEKEISFTLSFIKAAVSHMTNLGRIWVNFILNQWVLVIRSLMCLKRLPEKSPLAKEPKKIQKKLYKRKYILLCAKLSLHHTQYHNNSHTKWQQKYCQS